MHTKQITFLGQIATLACDGVCHKALGVSRRPKIELDANDPDDFAWLADAELGEAPTDPGTYEGGQAKPDGPRNMNKWCARECERSEMFGNGDLLEVRGFSQRLYNQPWKHANTGVRHNPPSEGAEH